MALQATAIWTGRRYMDMSPLIFLPSTMINRVSRPSPQLPEPVRAAVADFQARLRERFGERLRELRLFGSYARGEANAESDVDLLTVPAGLDHRTRREVFDLAEDIYAETGIALGPLAISDDECLPRRARLAS